MSGSDSETLGAIVVSRNVVTSPPKIASKEVNSKPEEKLCSGCRSTQPIDNFLGTQRYEGKEMRTCLSCRSKHVRSPNDTPARPVGTPARKRSVTSSPNVEPDSRNRLTRRQSTLDTTVAASPAVATTNRITNRPAVYTSQTRTPALRRSLTVTSLVTPTIQEKLTRETNDDDNTDIEEEGYPAAPVLQSLKRQSTTPCSTSEDMYHEDAIQVQLPQPKRHRMNGAPVVQHQIELDTDAEIGDEAEEGEQPLNSNGNPVGSDLAAFATSLGRLSQLLITAGKNLDNERIGALENEIHHDWRVDEMATFVEGFLKGASANVVAKGW